MKNRIIVSIATMVVLGAFTIGCEHKKAEQPAPAQQSAPAQSSAPAEKAPAATPAPAKKAPQGC